MEKRIQFGAVYIVSLLVITAHGMAADTTNGEKLFKQYCSACHPRAAMMMGERIVEITRNPQAVMPQFGNDKISDRDLTAIAGYIRSEIDKMSREKASR